MKHSTKTNQPQYFMPELQTFSDRVFGNRQLQVEIEGVNPACVYLKLTGDEVR